MNKGLCSVFLFFIICVSCGYPQQYTEIINGGGKVYFCINPKDRQIVLPVQLNDSITARLGFDTGGQFVLDSMFCATHSSIKHRLFSDAQLRNGSGWANFLVTCSIYSNAPIVRVGKVSLKYDVTQIMNWKWYMNSSSEGMFNIPPNDTMHVWELNFEHNYMEIHLAQNYRMPDNSLIFPLVRKKEYPNLLYVRLPIKMECASSDTLMINRMFMIDTGMAWDIVLMQEANEFSFFNKQEDVVWTKYLNRYHRYCPVDAILADTLRMDSLRVYTFDFINRAPSNYLIGQNFLKRFNVFFDMKSQRLGLQPIKNYERVVNPRKKRFHMSSRMNSHGKIIITKIADYEGNYVKESGLLEGDEIIAINEIPIKMISLEEDAELSRQDTLIYDIVRQGKSYKIPVVIDRNEVQGD